jgi:hypothetical protein
MSNDEEEYLARAVKNGPILNEKLREALDSIGDEEDNG